VSRSSFLKASGVGVQAAEMEVDGGPKSVTIPVAAGHVLDPLESRVHSLQASVGDPQDNGVDDVPKGMLDGLCDFADRFELGADRPWVPFLPRLGRPATPAVSL